jgi:cell division protein FtsQ
VGRSRYSILLSFLVILAIVLLSRLVYWYCSDPERFPVNTVKVVASYQQVTRQQLESILAAYVHESFISFPIKKLYSDLMALEWVNDVEIRRNWPGTLKIILKEKQPIALWNQSYLMTDGKLLAHTEQSAIDESLPKLIGPTTQKNNVLQMYQKLSKLLRNYELQLTLLQLRDNQAWDLSLMNGVQLRLGKQDIEKRVLRFCRAYPVVFAEKSDQLASVDLRYAHGMAVLWKELSDK